MRGTPATCSRPSCVIADAPGRAPSFFLDVQGFDAPPTYRGVEGRPFGHFNIWAMKPADAPSGCWHGRPLGPRTVGGVTASVYDCPSAESDRAQREIQHGEGLLSQHLLYEWSTADARCFVSVHGGDTPSNRRMLDRVLSGLQFA